MNNKFFVGIDIGTSSAKAALLNQKGEIVSVSSNKEYPILTPEVGWAEQDPNAWIDAVSIVCRDVLKKASVSTTEVLAIALSGQMHGTVLLDSKNKLLSPAIIWADQRSGSLCNLVNKDIGLENLAGEIGNRLSPGFMASTLLWLSKESPDKFEMINTALLPKDYVRYRLTDNIGTDSSDASGTGLYDIRRKDWAVDFCQNLGIRSNLMPTVYPSAAIDGSLTSNSAQLLSLSTDTSVVMGGADQAMAALGHGVTEPGELLITIGTGGQILAPTIEPVVDPLLRLNSFCHSVDNRWYLLGATLSAGLSFRWLRDNVLRKTRKLSYLSLEAEAASVPPCSEGLVFLPYLLGERTPHMNSALRGAFWGLTIRHTHAHMARAIMEGVAFSFRDVYELIKELGIVIDRAIISGGGGRSKIWREIIANVLDLPLIHQPQIEHASPLGAAVLAGVGVGLEELPTLYRQNTLNNEFLVRPNPTDVEKYQKQFELYQSFSSTVVGLLGHEAYNFPL